MKNVNGKRNLGKEDRSVERAMGVLKGRVEQIKERSREEETNKTHEGKEYSDEGWRRRC